MLALSLTLGQERPTIGFISPDVVADIGGTVELVCTVKNGHEYPILWMRMESIGNKNTLPISTGPNLFVRDARFNLDHDPNAGTYKLTIKEVEKNDEGRYQCQVVADVKNMLTADVDLKVKVTPVLRNDTETLVSGEVGKSAELKCEADGFPSPKISWRRQDGTLLPNGKDLAVTSKLTISDLKREHRGNYTCTADNGVGLAKEKVLTLQVGFPPSIDLPRPRIPQATYYEADLECQIRAYPAPTIRWKKNTTDIWNDWNHRISHYAAEDEMIVTTLKIFSVYEEDFGQYTCEAGNRYGKSVQEMELYESNIPICPPLCGDTDLNSAHFMKPPTSMSVAFVAVLLIKLLI